MKRYLIITFITLCIGLTIGLTYLFIHYAPEYFENKDMVQSCNSYTDNLITKYCALTIENGIQPEFDCYR